MSGGRRYFVREVSRPTREYSANVHSGSTHTGQHGVYIRIVVSDVKIGNFMKQLHERRSSREDWMCVHLIGRAYSLYVHVVDYTL